MSMAFDFDRLSAAKAEVFGVVAGHVFGREGSAPRVLDASLMFLKRRYPELWNEDDGKALLDALRAVEAGDTYETTEQMRDALLVVAEAHGVPVSLERYRFKNR